MGICASTSIEDGEAKKRSAAIDKALEEDSKKLRRECKILLLGEYNALQLFEDVFSPRVVNNLYRVR